MDPGVKNLGGETKVFGVRFESKLNALKLGLSVKISAPGKIITKLRRRPRRR